MLTRIAAIVVAVAVAIGPLHAADEPGRVHVKLRFVDDGEKKTQVTTQIKKPQDEGIVDFQPTGEYCPSGLTQVKVMGVDGIFCVENTPCGGYTEGECPGPQAGLEFGSTCVATEYGGLACVPAAYYVVDDFHGGTGDSGDDGSQSNDYGSWGDDEGSWDDEGSGDDEEGSGDDEGSWDDGGSWDGFDTWGEDDPDSSGSGEYPWYGWADSSGWGEGSGGGDWFGSGYGDASGGDDDLHPVCSYGQSPMSVEGVEGYFCVSGQSCVGEIMGTCPEPQPGLEYGAYCGTVASGVFGCKPMTEDMYNNLYLPAGGDDSGSDLVDPYMCEDGLYSISVEGVEGAFCVAGPICVADTTGTCPEAQEGLEFGSYCDVVQSGVLGCKPYTSAPVEDSDSGSGSEPAEENDPTLPVVDYPFCSAEGDSQMSVEGVPGVFCVNGQACAGVDGACPGPQPGLEFGSYCGTVQSGVKGCVPNVPTKKSAFKKIHTNKHKPAGKKTHQAKPHARQH